MCKQRSMAINLNANHLLLGFFKHYSISIASVITAFSINLFNSTFCIPQFPPTIHPPASIYPSLLPSPSSLFQPLLLPFLPYSSPYLPCSSPFLSMFLLFSRSIPPSIFPVFILLQLVTVPSSFS